MDLGVMSVEYTMEGEQNGTMELNRKTGFINSGQLSQEIDGEMKMMGMNVPMHISSKITIDTY